MKRLLLVLCLLPLATGDPPAPAVRGVVLDPAGRALHGARVVLRSRHASCLIVPGYSFLTARTDASGRFSLERPPRDMEVCVEHDDYAPAWAPARDGAVLRLRHPAYLEGVVPEGCRVSATLGLRVLAAAESEGEFRLGPLPPGERITITALSRCHRPFQRTITLKEGETRWIRVALDPGLALSGRVVPAEAGVVLRASQGDARESRATSDDSGAFVLRGLRAGEVCVVVLAVGRDPQVVCGAAGGFLEVRLDR